jgi:hypothetical protein
MTIDANHSEVQKPGKIELKNPPPIKHQVERPRQFQSADGTVVVMSEATDSPNIGLSEYKKSEVEQIVLGIEKSSVLHLDATSGSGVSKFIIPETRNRLGGDDKVIITEESKLEDLSHYAEILQPGQILILDEFTRLLDEFHTNPNSVVSQFKKMSEKGVRVIFCIGETDTTRDDLARLKVSISSEEIPQVVTRPKPFNEQQAKEYFNSITIKNESITPEDSDKIFKFLMENSLGLPLHFTWMKNVVPYLKDYFQFETSGKKRIIPQTIIEDAIRPYLADSKRF